MPGVGLGRYGLRAAQRTAVSCAAGERLERAGPRQEAAARQCACGRPLERQKRWGVASA